MRILWNIGPNNVHGFSCISLVGFSSGAILASIVFPLSELFFAWVGLLVESARTYPR